MECDIPLHKLRLPAMKEFLEKYTDKVVPGEKLKGKKLWVSIDETTDSSKRSVVNLVAGVLESD